MSSSLHSPGSPEQCIVSEIGRLTDYVRHLNSVTRRYELGPFEVFCFIMSSCTDLGELACLIPFRCSPGMALTHRRSVRPRPKQKESSHPRAHKAQNPMPINRFLDIWEGGFKLKAVALNEARVLPGQEHAKHWRARENGL